MNDQEQQLRKDYEWVLHDQETQDRYAGQVVVVHQRVIWGIGPTHEQALDEALGRPNCPGRELLAKVYVEGYPLNGDD